MNLNELVQHVVEQSGVKKGDAAKGVHEVFAAIAGALRLGDEVKVAGFGTFGVAERAARRGRNPRTGEAIEVPAGRAPKFKPMRALKEAVDRATSG